MKSNNLDISIGNKITNYGAGEMSSLVGLIDELMIFDRALTLYEVQSIYDAGSQGVCE